jgi:hypothetical protein
VVWLIEAKVSEKRVSIFTAEVMNTDDGDSTFLQNIVFY